MGRDDTRQGISGIFRPRPPFHLEGIQRTCRPDGERHAFDRDQTWHACRHLGDQCPRLAYIPVCCRQDRSSGRYRQYQLQAERTGIPGRKRGYPYIMHYRRRVRRKLCRHGIYHVTRTEGITTWLPEKQTFPGSEECSLHRAGEIQRNVQHSRTAAFRRKRQ